MGSGARFCRDARGCGDHVKHQPRPRRQASAGVGQNCDYGPVRTFFTSSRRPQSGPPVSERTHLARGQALWPPAAGAGRRPGPWSAVPSARRRPCRRPGGTGTLLARPRRSGLPASPTGFREGGPRFEGVVSDDVPPRRRPASRHRQQHRPDTMSAYQQGRGGEQRNEPCHRAETLAGGQPNHDRADDCQNDGKANDPPHHARHRPTLQGLVVLLVTADLKLDVHAERVGVPSRPRGPTGCGQCPAEWWGLRVDLRCLRAATRETRAYRLTKPSRYAARRQGRPRFRSVLALPAPQGLVQVSSTLDCGWLGIALPAADVRVNVASSGPNAR